MTAQTTAEADTTILRVRDLRMHFPIQKGFLRRTVGWVKAVDGVDLELNRGQTLGLVGESGCGKTTTSRCILGGYEVTGGEILFNDPELGWVDIANLSKDEMFSVRRNAQIILQDPYGSLNPRMTVLDIVGEPLLINGIRGSEREQRVAELLSLVGLRPEYMSRYPHAFSGGQRQRIGIARALALQPQMVICDEPVSALDVSIQAQILNLLEELQDRFGLTYLFVAHQLNVVSHICDRVAVMYVGKVVESAPTGQLYARPRHPYTEALLSSVPRPDPRNQADEIVLEGEVADPANPPSGCLFHPRCRYAVEQCRLEEPELRPAGAGHFVRCHLADDLELMGVSTPAA